MTTDRGTADKAQAHLQDAELATAKQVICETRADGWSEEYCARQAGIKGRTLRGWLQADPEFAAAWADANVARGDWVEDKLREGAAAGRDVPAIVLAKMTGRFVEKGQADPEQIAQGIMSALRQLAAERRMVAQPAQLAAPEPEPQSS